MKKTLIALAVLGAAAGTAYAQTNVTIYGVVDTGYVKKTGHDLTMDENVNSRIGFKGVEDLGDGLKATFQLEKRFDVGTGENNSGAGKDWEGAANVGLKGDDWGWVRLGRVNGILTENIRKFDPFYQYGVGSMIDSTQRAVRMDKTLRYDSPDWAGFSVQASYSLGENMNSKSRRSASGDKWDDDYGYALVDENDHSNGYDNDGYAIGLNYKNGGFAATADYQLVADSNRSHVWGVGVSYAWDTVKVEALYQDTLDKGIKGGQNSNPKYAVWNKNLPEGVKASSMREQQALLGVEWKVGPGRLNASAQWLGIESKGWNGTMDDIDSDAYKVAVGYTYNLSKRTSLYGIVAYTDWDDKNVGKIMDGISQDSVTGVQLGITHKF